jgi:hypothetical protein
MLNTLLFDITVSSEYIYGRVPKTEKCFENIWQHSVVGQSS